MRLIVRSDELSGNPHPFLRAAHAAFQEVRNAELLRDLRGVLAGTLVLHGRGACDHAEVSGVEAAELCDQLLRESVGNVVLCRIAGQVLKRQHDQHHLVR